VHKFVCMVHLRSIIVFGKEGICSAVHDTLCALCTNVLPSGGSISLPQRGTQHPHARPQLSYTVAKLMLASTDPALHNTCGGVETKMCGRQQNTCHSRQAAHHDGSHGKAVVLVGRVSKATLIHSTISQSVQDGNGTVGLSRPRICSTGLIKSVQRSP
jgi:hypothetical protein